MILLLFACNPPPINEQKNSQISEQLDNNETLQLADFFEQRYLQDVQGSAYMIGKLKLMGLCE